MPLKFSFNQSSFMEKLDKNKANMCQKKYLSSLTALYELALHFLNWKKKGNC